VCVCLCVCACARAPGVQQLLCVEMQAQVPLSAGLVYQDVFDHLRIVCFSVMGELISGTSAYSKYR